jgi:putative SOS response-associated peptidase YedK
VVVPAELRAAWLDCTSEDAAAAAALLEQIPEAHLAPYVVSAAVGNVRNNGPQLIEPVADPDHADPGGAGDARAAAEQQTLDI